MFLQKKSQYLDLIKPENNRLTHCLLLFESPWDGELQNVDDLDIHYIQEMSTKVEVFCILL